jgi:hypothetical protein
MLVVVLVRRRRGRAVVRQGRRAVSRDGGDDIAIRPYDAHAGATIRTHVDTDVVPAEVGVEVPIRIDRAFAKPRHAVHRLEAVEGECRGGKSGVGVVVLVVVSAVVVDGKVLLEEGEEVVI